MPSVENNVHRGQKERKKELLVLWRKSRLLLALSELLLGLSSRRAIGCYDFHFRRLLWAPKIVCPSSFPRILFSAPLLFIHQFFIVIYYDLVEQLSNICYDLVYVLISADPLRIHLLQPELNLSHFAKEGMWHKYFNWNNKTYFSGHEKNGLFSWFLQKVSSNYESFQAKCVTYEKYSTNSMQFKTRPRQYSNIVQESKTWKRTV